MTSTHAIRSGYAALVFAVAAGCAASAHATRQDPRVTDAPRTVATASPTAPAPVAGAPAAPAPAASARPTAAPAAPGDYIIGTDDVLSILFWRDKDLSGDVTVRPDGKVTLPLLNDVQAAGLTPEALREAIREAARTFVEDPNPSVIVKEIKSRRVFITGQIEKPGPYPLNGQMTVLQLIATAGGMKEFADGRNISVMRTEGGQVVVFPFNYRDVTRRKNLQQNIELKPGDTVVVP